MGVRKTADFLEKGTWFLAISLLVLSLATTMFVKDGSSTGADGQEPVESATRKVASEKAIAAPVAPPAGMQNNNMAAPPDSGK